MPSTPDTEQLRLATVAGVSSYGVRLTLDGQSSAGSKQYKQLAGQSLSTGDRVLVAKVSGSYVIIGKIVTS